MNILMILFIKLYLAIYHTGRIDGKVREKMKVCFHMQFLMLTLKYIAICKLLEFIN